MSTPDAAILNCAESPHFEHKRSPAEAFASLQTDAADTGGSNTFLVQGMYCASPVAMLPSTPDAVSDAVSGARVRRKSILMY